MTQGPKEGGIYLSPWNHARWLSLQRTHKAEYIFSSWWKNPELFSNQSKFNFWNQQNPTFAFVCRLLTQTATWQPNTPNFSSIVTAILKAMTNTDKWISISVTFSLHRNYIYHEVTQTKNFFFFDSFCLLLLPLHAMYLHCKYPETPHKRREKNSTLDCCNLKYVEINAFFTQNYNPKNF